jgi:hypothetical protein
MNNLKQPFRRQG